MKTRPKILLTAALSVGALALLLGAAAGSQTDPLVTMSYLNDVNAPAILKQVESKLDSREQALVDKLDAVADAYVQEVEGLLGSSGGTGTASSVFSVVTVKAGQQAGEARYSLNGEVIGSVPILFAGSVKKAGYRDYVGKIAGYFLL